MLEDGVVTVQAHTSVRSARCPICGRSSRRVHGHYYALLLWGLFGGDGVNRGLMVGLDAYFIVHVLLHVLFIRHPEYRFRSAFSWVLILGAGVFGTLDLIITS